MIDQITPRQHLIAGAVLFILAVIVFFSYRKRVLIGVESSLNELEKNIYSSLVLANELVENEKNLKVKSELIKLIECLKKTKSDLPAILNNPEKREFRRLET